jgi:hypothetical protein
VLTIIRRLYTISFYCYHCYHVCFPVTYLLINGIIVDLKQVIDQIDRNSKKAKDLIAEIARRLDQGRFCETSHISRRIKEMLQDKIKEGKITTSGEFYNL